MKVRIYSRKDDGEPEELGAIVLENALLIPHPKVPALTNLLAEPPVVYEGEKRIFIEPKKSPSVFCEP